MRSPELFGIVHPMRQYEHEQSEEFDAALEPDDERMADIGPGHRPRTWTSAHPIQTASHHPFSDCPIFARDDPARISHYPRADVIPPAIPAPAPASPPAGRQSFDEIDDASRFVLEIGRALHRFGTPAHRLEQALSTIAASLQLRGELFMQLGGTVRQRYSQALTVQNLRQNHILLPMSSRRSIAS